MNSCIYCSAVRVLDLAASEMKSKNYQKWRKLSTDQIQLLLSQTPRSDGRVALESLLAYYMLERCPNGTCRAFALPAPV